MPIATYGGASRVEGMGSNDRCEHQGGLLYGCGRSASDHAKAKSWATSSTSLLVRRAFKVFAPGGTVYSRDEVRPWRALTEGLRMGGSGPTTFVATVRSLPAAVCNGNLPEGSSEETTRKNLREVSTRSLFLRSQLLAAISLRPSSNPADVRNRRGRPSRPTALDLLARRQTMRPFTLRVHVCPDTWSLPA